MKFRTIYSHDRAISALFATHNTEESMTQQDDAKDCDINVIMRRYQKTGQLPNVLGTALGGDFTETADYREMVEQIQKADELFKEIPADIRGRFLNDPARFIQFASNPDNLPELRKLGLAEPERPPPKEPAPIKVIVTNPEEPAP